jgi:hypothetical protein
MLAFDGEGQAEDRDHRHDGDGAADTSKPYENVSLSRSMRAV